MKKEFICLLVFTCFSITMAAQKKLTVIVDGFLETKGNLMVGVYNSPSTFLKKTYKGEIVKVTHSTVEVSFELPDGEYAISVYHDLNENNKLDTGMFGIPTEKYGASNNSKGVMGPPSFQKAKFELSKDTIVRINLH